MLTALNAAKLSGDQPGTFNSLLVSTPVAFLDTTGGCLKSM